MNHDFDTIIKDYGGLLSRVASTYEANDAIRQELLQEIALAVWQGLERFKGNSSLKTYVLKIAHNRAVSHIAGQVRRRDEIDMAKMPQAEASDHSEPDMAYAQQQKMHALLTCVRTLPLPSRQVLTLSLEGLSYDEIAEVCGLTKSHVGVLLNRAKQTLSRRLSNEQ
ncbi:RNA polymerase sigma factor [Alteromonas halophila]|uniref:RNA polymerase subunit sigma n=1 Tax=Alteromonas halophila TaxID=516698 RepID=A0A918JPV3_9ALTE|nr:sigma-70 family RNA polymerase sigma factor [Alteromonas halophila]GGW91370.1 RNA polymerase subunit sigma [Alteromonas halophila]